MRKWTWNKSSMKHKSYKKAPDIVEVNCNPKNPFSYVKVSCYCPTKALHLAVSGISAGPGGTETMEDLGCALGMIVKSFNYSEPMDDGVRCSVKQYGDCCLTFFM